MYLFTHVAKLCMYVYIIRMYVYIVVCTESSGRFFLFFVDVLFKHSRLKTLFGHICGSHIEVVTMATDDLT